MSHPCDEPCLVGRRRLGYLHRHKRSTARGPRGHETTQMHISFTPTPPSTTRRRTTGLVVVGVVADGVSEEGQEALDVAEGDVVVVHALRLRVDAGKRRVFARVPPAALARAAAALHRQAPMNPSGDERRQGKEEAGGVGRLLSR